MGHMNVQFYAQKSVMAHWVQWAQLGFARAQWGADMQPVLREHHMRFLAEQLPGTPFYMCGGEAALDTPAASDSSAASDPSEWVGYQEMRHSTTHKPLAAFTSRWQCVGKNGPHAWPEHLREKLAAWRVRPPPHGQPRGIALSAPRPRPTRADAERLGMLTSWLGTLLPSHCDQQGRMQDWSVIALVSDAIPNLLTQTQKFDPGAAVQNRRGGAALEYRLIHHAPARAGDALQLYSGLRAIGNKTLNWVHWLCDVASGQAIATAEAVAISMDLEQRKAVAMDDATRAQLASLVQASLSV